MRRTAAEAEHQSKRSEALLRTGSWKLQSLDTSVQVLAQNP